MAITSAKYVKDTRTDKNDGYGGQPNRQRQTAHTNDRHEWQVHTTGT